MNFVSHAKRSRYIFSAVLLALWTVHPAPAQSAGYHLIQVPESTQTSVDGANNLDQVVGWYFDAKGNGHGFLLSNGKYLKIDFGQGNFTVANGINDAGGNRRILAIFLGRTGAWLDPSKRILYAD